MRSILRSSAASFALLVQLLAPGGQLSAQAGKVRVVLFFAPTCPHCHDVIQDHLPIFFDIYGGAPQIWMDPSVPDIDRSLYLMYNEQLEILLVDATRPLGGRLFVAALETQGIPPPMGSVPRMVFGETVLVGGVEIPSRFHALMRQALADGGLDWPAIPGLAEVAAVFPTATSVVADSEVVARAESPDRTPQAAADSVVVREDTVATEPLAAQPADPRGAADPGAARRAQEASPRAVPESGTTVTPRPQPEVTGAGDIASTPDSASGSAAQTDSHVADSASNPFAIVPQRRTTVLEKLQRDPVGNGLSVVVLLAMVASVAIVVGTDRLQGRGTRPPPAILVVALLGIAVASYLSYVETSGATAVCGPVGDCNTVQQSQYAVLLGVIPVGTLGLLAYIAIIGTWFVARSGSQPITDYARLSLLAIAFVGTLFSIYLTFLEPFVIGATCAWCLASSIAITLLLWLSARSGKAALARLRANQGSD